MAITSSTDICKLSLDLLQGGSVSDISSPSTAIEEACNRWYDHTRRKLLRQHPWNFAITRAELAASATAPVFGAELKFPLPADCLRLLQVVDADNRIFSSESYFFEGNALMMFGGDDAVVRILYVADEQDVTKFDALFIELLAVEVALSMAYLVTQNNTNVDRLSEVRKRLVVAAKAVDGQEHPPRSRRSSVNHSARMSLGLHDATRHEV